jgi:hypothetical protein
MVAQEIAVEVQPWRPIFEKCSHLREKGGGLIFSQVCMMGCIGRISHTNLKKSYGDFRNRNFEKFT